MRLLTREKWCGFALLFLLFTACQATKGLKGGDGPAPGAERKVLLNEEIIDLATITSASRTISARVPFDILVYHKLPGARYGVSVVQRAIAIPAFELPAQTPDAAGKQGLAGDDQCDAVESAFDKLYAATLEEQLPPLYNALARAIAQNPSCQGASLGMATDALTATRMKVGSFTLQPGEQLEIIITRVVGNETRTWKQVYTTQPRGEWQVSYGFSFIPQTWSKEQLYYSAPMGTEFMIKKEENRKRFTYAPSLFFTWMPTKHLAGPWSVNLGGGLGFDMQNPTLFAGPSISYNQNIKLNLGLVAHRQRVLLGKYQGEQIISENLSADQLHESLYRINPFFSLSLRFTQNPFSRNE